jgi:membrane-associated phospholipid phosphatase
VLLVAAIGIFAVGLIIGFVVVGRHGGGPIQGWDNTVERWYPLHRGSLVGASRFVATYLDAAPLAVICVVLTAILIVTLRSTRALIPIVAYLGGEFQVFIIRELILRHRPPTAVYPAPGAIKGVHETSYSFPSGHSVAVTAVLFALLGTIARHVASGGPGQSLSSPRCSWPTLASYWACTGSAMSPSAFCSGSPGASRSPGSSAKSNGRTS